MVEQHMYTSQRRCGACCDSDQIKTGCDAKEKAEYEMRRLREKLMLGHICDNTVDFMVNRETLPLQSPLLAGPDKLYRESDYYLALLGKAFGKIQESNSQSRQGISFPVLGNWMGAEPGSDFRPGQPPTLNLQLRTQPPKFTSETLKHNFPLSH